MSTDRKEFLPGDICTCNHELGVVEDGKHDVWTDVDVCEIDCHNEKQYVVVSVDKERDTLLAFNHELGLVYVWKNRLVKL